MKLKLLGCLMVGMIGFFSCQKATPEEKDKEAIMTLIQQDSVWFNVNTEVDSTGEETLLLSEDSVTIIWWRSKQTHPDTNINITVENDSAYVEWERTNVGKLNIWAYTVSDSSWHFWQKDVNETARLNAIFLRTGDVSDENRGWELKKISCAWGQSNEQSTVFIDSVKIESESNPSLVIKDPLSTFYDVDSLVTFKPAEEVKITLYTHGSESRAFLHTFILVWPFYVRTRFTPKEEGVHEGTWHAQLIEFPRYAIFDLLNYNTLYTEEGKYDFNGWLLPYTIAKE